MLSDLDETIRQLLIAELPIKNGEIDLVINTPSGKKPKADEVAIRTQSVAHNIPCITTLFGAQAAVNGIESLLKRGLSVRSIQEYHQGIKDSRIQEAK